MVYWTCWFRIQTWIFEILTQNPFLGKFGPKSQGCPFFLKISTRGISKMLLLIPTLAFWIYNPKSIFGQIWAKKVKVVHFGWKLAHIVSCGCPFLFRHYFFQFPTLNPFLSKFGPKKSKLFVLPENWHLEYLKDVDSYSDTSFGANLVWKSQSCLLCLKIGTHTYSPHKHTCTHTHTHTHTHAHTHTNTRTRTEREYLGDAISYFDISFLKFQT